MSEELGLTTLPTEEIVLQIKDDLYDGLAAEVVAAVKELLRRGLTPYDVLTGSLVAGMDVVGADFRDGILFVPEVLMAAKSMKAGMEILRPLLVATGAPQIGTLVIGTVKGDIHDIGKNLVAAMLQANGFEVHDLGADVKLERFLNKAEEVGADAVCLSALLTTTMLGQRRFIEMLKARNLAGRFKVLVGGAPVTRKWANEIGADGYAENAVAAVKLASDILKK